MKWKTKQGKVMDISDMEDSHIINSINMLKRRLKTKPCRQVYGGNSDYAEMAVEEENRVNDNIAEDIEDIIWHLKDEQTRRIEHEKADSQYHKKGF